MKRSCKRVYVPFNVCYVSFVREKTKKKYSHSSSEELWTVRGEQLVLDFNKKGEVIGLELLGDKACQQA